MGWGGDLWNYVTEDVGEGVGHLAVGIGQGIIGTTEVVAGGALATAGYVVDPVLYTTAGFAVGVADSVNDGIGDPFNQADKLDDAQEAIKWPGWGDGILVQTGENLAMDGLDNAAIAFGHGRDAATSFVPGGEDTDFAGETRDFVEAANNRNYGPADYAVQVLLSPNKLGKVITIGGIIYDSTQLLRDNGTVLPDELTQEEYDSIWNREKSRILTAMEIRSLQSDVEDAEQASSLTQEQAGTYLRVLMGPDGWGALGDSARGMQAYSLYQAGDYAGLNREWQAWRSAGGIWRNDT
jgi:hypothetical protein